MMEQKDKKKIDIKALKAQGIGSSERLKDVKA